MVEKQTTSEKIQKYGKKVSAYTGSLPIDEVLEVQRCRFVKSLGTDISIVHALLHCF